MFGSFVCWLVSVLILSLTVATRTKPTHPPPPQSSFIMLPAAVLSTQWFSSVGWLGQYRYIVAVLVPKLVFALACLCALVTPGVCLVTTGPVTKTNLSISWSAGAALVLKCWGPGLAWAVRVLQWRDWSAFVGLQVFRYAGFNIKTQHGCFHWSSWTRVYLCLQELIWGICPPFWSRLQNALWTTQFTLFAKLACNTYGRLTGVFPVCDSVKWTLFVFSRRLCKLAFFSQIVHDDSFLEFYNFILLFVSFGRIWKS